MSRTLDGCMDAAPTTTLISPIDQAGSMGGGGHSTITFEFDSPSNFSQPITREPIEGFEKYFNLLFELLNLHGDDTPRHNELLKQINELNIWSDQSHKSSVSPSPMTENSLPGPGCEIDHSDQEAKKLILNSPQALPSPHHRGIAGEYLVMSDLSLLGFDVLMTNPSMQYDVAVVIGGRLVRIQVKSTAHTKTFPGRHGDFYEFKLYGPGGIKYDVGAFDIAACVALDIRQIAYVPFRDTVNIRLSKPGSGEACTGKPKILKNIDEYSFKSALEAIS